MLGHGTFVCVNRIGMIGIREPPVVAEIFTAIDIFDLRFQAAELAVARLANMGRGINLERHETTEIVKAVMRALSKPPP